CESRGVCLNLYECKVICCIVRHHAACHFRGEPKRHLHKAAIFYDMIRSRARFCLPAFYLLVPQAETAELPVMAHAGQRRP
ncbi:MAG: hypothetical protein ACR2KT_10765, partial [Methylocella sp.]